MPKLRMTEQERREKALMTAYTVGKELKGLNNADIAKLLDVSENTLRKYTQNRFHGVDFWDAVQLFRLLGFSGNEVCKITGCSYENDELERLLKQIVCAAS